MMEEFIKVKEMLFIVLEVQIVILLVVIMTREVVRVTVLRRAIKMVIVFQILVIVLGLMKEGVILIVPVVERKNIVVVHHKI
jgi:hypothetical protein